MRNRRGRDRGLGAELYIFDTPARHVEKSSIETPLVSFASGLSEEHGRIKLWDLTSESTQLR